MGNHGQTELAEAFSAPVGDQASDENIDLVLVIYPRSPEDVKQRALLR